ncbi:MAG TPA: 7-cyano-7-deazaguanine synthase, partial [Candidatus Cryosericum sp.]
LLWGDNRDIEFKIDDITERMGAKVPDRYIDLLDIAAYVYSADQTTPRGGAGSRDMNALWRRDMYFVIPVRCLDFWSQQKVRETLTSTLNWLSDDSYDFHFVTLDHPPPPQEYFKFSKEAVVFKPDEILLFSGGLDSLGGAVKEIFEDGKRVALVSHRSAPKINPKQQLLHADMCRRSPVDLRPKHIPVWVHKHGWEAVDDSQRARSFLYTSLAATVATMFGKDRIRFYENGVTSLNLPVTEQILGARATRTTHPKTIAGFRSILSLVADRDFQVETPFFWKTKTDILDLIKKAGQAELIKHTVSCSHVWGMTKLHTHCGRCSQCIDRRLAVFASNVVEHDPDEMYHTDVFIGSRSDKNQDIVMAESYVRSMRQCADLSATQFFARYGEASRAVPYVSGKADDVAGMILQLYTRNGQQVKRAIAGAVKHYADRLGESDLPNRCLMRQLFGATVPTGALQPQKKLVEVTRPKTQNWKDVTIEIVDDNTARYRVSGDPWKRATYAELGFADKRKGLPNKLWGLFKVLAEHCADGCVEMHTISNVAKDMDRIRSTLRAFFGIGDLPFKYDKKAQVYRMGLRLADRRHDQESTDAVDA